MKELESPLVSVVTPCLNAERYIEQCMESVKAQDYPKVEHVIVDGKSKDSTVSIIRKHERDYNVKWISEGDRNATDATNKGMKMSTGSILGILPADDLYLPWTVRTVVEKFSERPETDLVYGDLIQVAYGSNYGTLYFNPPEAELGTHLRFNSIGGMSVFFRKRVFDALNEFDESMPFVSDYDFWLRARQKFKFSKVDEVLACFRYREDSISIGNPRAQSAERARLAQRYGVEAGTSLESVGYYSRRVFAIAQWLVRLLGEMRQPRPRPGPWTNLVRTNCISPMRLAAAIIFAPLFSTNNVLQRRIGFGYVRIDRIYDSRIYVTSPRRSVSGRE